MNNDPIELLKELVSINSVNPDLVPGGAGEGKIADFCAAWLRERGFEVHRIEEHAGRPSIVGIARGSGGGRSLMFNGHYDTVSIASYDGDALDPVIRDGKLFGRGSFDMKGGVAAMMVAAARAKENGLRGDILVACVADEEYASFGSEEVAARFKADAAIVTEPSHHELTTAHRGFVWFDVIVQGRASHGSRPELGIDAIVKAGKFLVALEELDKRLRANPTHPLLGSGSVHASLIKGGEELSSYPAECRISLERRTIPGENAATVAAELQAVIAAIAAADPDFKATLAAGLERPPFEVAESEPIVAMLDRIATERLGKRPARRGEPFWTDCAILQGAGIPCVMFGADGGGAHAASEWAEVRSVETLADILTDTAVSFCG
ncbi:acetylornithine deacetylase [Mesorhizobium sp. L-8-10]|uniref:ArgE/DapE family deacylase n=1 Tax=Mesorhizobium sp. L-8-10 TaxID=2744523 RepID=UPI0019252F73|nr:ArgE/DapE family deacylase [Mesorhizobium sp. L-8-10]BCH30809.1 acetylornithine deacetylase [Mesorhizobium sp. L-8-10]